MLPRKQKKTAINMKEKNNASNRRVYVMPDIERIILDNEISLALESSPPSAPGEEANNTSEYFNNDPFKANFG